MCSHGNIKTQKGFDVNLKKKRERETGQIWEKRDIGWSSGIWSCLELKEYNDV